MKVALIPIDNRPVCYSLVKDIANIDKDLELFLPNKDLLGGLRSYAKVNEILNWVETLRDVDAIVVALDTIAHGGLISSRRSKDTLEEIEARLKSFRSKINKKTKIYAFSSIMRISNNNVNEEEKEYWSEYGEKIFAYSYNFHKNGEELDEVPHEILTDYLATRQRNFTINKMYLNWAEEGVFDTLVFSKDDCAEYGLNVLESEILQKMIKDKKLSESKSVLIKTGADEIPLALLSRAVVDFKKNKESKTVPKISVRFLESEYKDLISNYEDISIEKSVNAQIELSGCEIVDENLSDLVLIVNNFEQKQGEIVMKVKTKPFEKDLVLPEKHFMVADVRFANGADNKFVKKLLKKDLGTNFYGYSAWNTSANTLGSLICAAIIKLLAQNYNNEAFIKLQLIRFLDDWAYQANVRQTLKIGSKRPNIIKLKNLMVPFEKKLGKIFGVNPKARYYFPWKRFFEVGIGVKI